MIARTMFRFATLMLPLLGTAAAVAPTRAGPTKTRVADVAEVIVVGTDYAFSLPPHIKAGPTFFAFDNRGQMRHELALTLLRRGGAADSALRMLIQGTGRRRDLVEGVAALLIAGPGERSDSAAGPRLWLRLERGRIYLVTCTLADRPGQPSHATLGMVASFIAE